MWLLSEVTLILTLAPGSIRLARLTAVLRGGGGAGGGGDPAASAVSSPRSCDKGQIGGIEWITDYLRTLTMSENRAACCTWRAACLCGGWWTAEDWQKSAQKRCAKLPGTKTTMLFQFIILCIHKLVAEIMTLNLHSELTHLVWQRVLGILPLPAPVGQGDGKQRAPEQDVAERDDEEDPDLGGPVPPDPPGQVRHQPLVTWARPEGSHLNTVNSQAQSCRKKVHSRPLYSCHWIPCAVCEAVWQWVTCRAYWLGSIIHSEYSDDKDPGIKYHDDKKQGMRMNYTWTRGQDGSLMWSSALAARAPL